jgi:predicted amidohydrolase YtcJ
MQLHARGHFQRIVMFKELSLAANLACTGRIVLAATLSACIGLSGCAQLPQGSADAVYLDGNIITVDKAFSVAQAVAIKDGKFIRVGRTDEVRGLVGPGTRVVNLGEKTVLPGLMDSHTHMDGAGTWDTTAQVGDAGTVAEALAIIKDFVASKKVPAGKWVETSAWHPLAQLQEHRYLTRQELDATVPNNPIFVQTVAHFAMVNSKALQLAGIARDTPNPVGGRIHRDASGEATGVLEATAIEMVAKIIPPPSHEELVSQMISAERIYNRSGITSAVVADLKENQVKAFLSVAERGQASVRVGLFWNLNTGDPAEFERKLKGAPFKDDPSNDWARVSGLKFIADGGMTLRSAFLREHYANEPHNHGTRSVDPVAYEREVILANRLGWRVHTHAVGDAAVDLVLKAYTAANADKSIAQKRFSIVHGSLSTPEQIRAAKQLGVRVDAQNAFLWDKAKTAERFLGPDLVQRAVPTRNLLDILGFAGTAAGTDHEVNILNPFISMYLMVTRKDPRGIVFGADQKVSRVEALRLYTNSGPYLTFEENKKGSIESGRLADMVVISADYLKVPEEQIKDIVPLQTIVGGKVVYDAADARK